MLAPESPDPLTFVIVFLSLVTNIVALIIYDLLFYWNKSNQNQKIK